LRRASVRGVSDVRYHRSDRRLPPRLRAGRYPCGGLIVHSRSTRSWRFISFELEVNISSRIVKIRLYQAFRIDGFIALRSN